MKQTNKSLSTINRKNTVNLGIWTAIWLISLAFVTFGAKFLWDFNGMISTLGILVNMVIGLGMILANKKYIDGLDELQRKIYLDATGITLGIGVVAGIGYSTFDMVNVISYDAEIPHLVALMGITYLISVIIGQIRYR